MRPSLPEVSRHPEESTAAAERLLPETRGEYERCPERTPGQGYSPGQSPVLPGLSPYTLCSLSSLWFAGSAAETSKLLRKMRREEQAGKGDPWTSSQRRRRQPDPDLQLCIGPTPGAPHRKGCSLAAGEQNHQFPLHVRSPWTDNPASSVFCFCFTNSWILALGRNGDRGIARGQTTPRRPHDSPSQLRVGQQQW